MKKLLLFSFWVFQSISLLCQNHDYFWIMGYAGGINWPLDDQYGNVIFNFDADNHPDVIPFEEGEIDFEETCASICDSLGNLMFYSNGTDIYNKVHQIMKNGNDVSNQFGGEYGYRLSQGVLIVPVPEQTNKYLHFQTRYKLYPGEISGWNLYQSKIDMGLENGQGTVTDRSQLVIEDTVSYGKMTATKHANGRDWWALLPEYDTKAYYRLMVGRNGVGEIKKIYGENKVIDGDGQVCFSPNGQHYVRVVSKYYDQPFDIHVYDFDRCSGELSNHRTKIVNEPSFGTGASISPDSRYLYVLTVETVYQYDLTAPDIFATETIVARFDGFQSGDFYKTYFKYAQLGPDGRIYVASNPTLHMHKIAFPNRKGEACLMQQHSIYLDVYSYYAIPNNPNYRLGPLDGSPCDTLGLDNHPLARFRWDFEDTLNPARVTFTDNSFYEPATWHWDFAGLGTSQDTSPVFVFPQPGVYDVCLTVCNANACDTICHAVTVGVSEVFAPFASVEVLRVWPNPATHEALLSLPPGGLPERGTLSLFAASGAVAKTQAVPPGSETCRVAVDELPPGLYFFALSLRGRVLGRGKLVVSE